MSATIAPAPPEESTSTPTHEDTCWQEYAQAVFNPLGSEEQRHEAFERAMASMNLPVLDAA
jgi:hypothetical protein